MTQMQVLRVGLVLEATLVCMFMNIEDIDKLSLCRI